MNAIRGGFLSSVGLVKIRGIMAVLDMGVEPKIGGKPPKMDGL